MADEIRMLPIEISMQDDAYFDEQTGYNHCFFMLDYATLESLLKARYPQLPNTTSYPPVAIDIGYRLQGTPTVPNREGWKKEWTTPDYESVLKKCAWLQLYFRQGMRPYLSSETRMDSGNVVPMELATTGITLDYAPVIPIGRFRTEAYESEVSYSFQEYSEVSLGGGKITGFLPRQGLELYTDARILGSASLQGEGTTSSGTLTMNGTGTSEIFPDSFSFGASAPNPAVPGTFVSSGGTYDNPAVTRTGTISLNNGGNSGSVNLANVVLSIGHLSQYPGEIPQLRETAIPYGGWSVNLLSGQAQGAPAKLWRLLGACQPKPVVGGVVAALPGVTAKLVIDCYLWARGGFGSDP